MSIGAGPEAFWNPSAPTQISELALSHCRIIEREVPVIYGGDLTNQSQSVADAIASGKQGAMALDIYFKQGWGAIEERLASCRVGDGPALSMAAYHNAEPKSRKAHVVSIEEINSDYFQPQPRVSPAAQPPGTRVRSFAEIVALLSLDAAAQELDRCFNCGVCNACDYCRLYCPEMAVIADTAKRWIHMDYCKGCGICVTVRG